MYFSFHLFEFCTLYQAHSVNLTNATYAVPDSFHIRTDDDNWSEIHHAVLHEAQELQGRYIFY